MNSVDSAVIYVSNDTPNHKIRMSVSTGDRGGRRPFMVTFGPQQLLQLSNNTFTW